MLSKLIPFTCHCSIASTKRSSSTEFSAHCEIRGPMHGVGESSNTQWGGLTLAKTDYLLNSPHDRAGALSFGLNEVPPAPLRDFNKSIQLESLLRAARELESLEFGAPLTPELRQLQQLVATGTSMGGARPKNVVEDEGGLWLAKFPSKDDRWNNAAVEAGMLSLASQCDIRTPPIPCGECWGACRFCSFNDLIVTGRKRPGIPTTSDPEW